MKVLIVRMYPDVLNIKNYNCQEIGLAKALIRKGNQCDIVLYTDKDEYEEDVLFDKDTKRIHVYYLKAKSFLKNAIFSKRLYEIAEKYDVIQTAEYDQIGNVLLKKKVGSKMVIYHGPYASEYTKGYQKKCLLSDLYFMFHKDYKDTPCLSKSKLATEFLKSKGFKNITTVGVGLDTERFESVNEPSEQIKSLMLKKKNEGLKYLLYIGKLEDRRNILFLIDACENVLKNNENVRLVLVGKGEKTYVDKCFEYAKSKGILDRIIYYESIPQLELPNLYKNCDIFLLPTQYEIFGMVLLEAMYFGMPVITTLNGGSSTLIENGNNGIISDLKNGERWTDSIVKVLDSEELETEISNNARKQIKENYTWDSLANNFIKIYKCGGLDNG